MVVFPLCVQEFLALVEENNALQQKMAVSTSYHRQLLCMSNMHTHTMQTQEEDFRLQNRTLMEELSKVSTQLTTTFNAC